ncbi:carbon-nitrogen hydrolase [Poriferisphaera sp. WC338]|uniref:carbon-nitrogen hydrolase n=1 Tax=Poriferisphaera sp. WC338 TaxID=3425129 RepID=UPI003D815981
MSEPHTNNLCLALLQFAVPIGSTSTQILSHVTDMVRTAAADGANIIVTPELFLSPYFPQSLDESNFDLAEPIPGPTSTYLQALADELNVTLHASLFERRAPGLYHNTSVTMTPEQPIQLYRKMHIPHDPHFEEKYYFTPGESFAIHATPHGNIGPLICWDQWFPEAARATALLGADLLVYPTAIAYLDSEPPEEQAAQRDAWITIQRSHAIANNLFVAACNRIGREGKLNFWGSSFIAAPDGTIIAQASETDEQIVIADLDLSMIETQRRAWPYLRDRLPHQYQSLTQQFADNN